VGESSNPSPRTGRKSHQKKEGLPTPLPNEITRAKKEREFERDFFAEDLRGGKKKKIFRSRKEKHPAKFEPDNKKRGRFPKRGKNYWGGENDRNSSSGGKKKSLFGVRLLKILEKKGLN